MKKIIASLLLIYSFAANSQDLTVRQITSLFKKDVSQINNYFNIKGWKYYKLIDTIEIKDIIWAYNLSGRHHSAAELWMDVYLKDNAVYSVKFTFGSNATYSTIVNNLSVLKVRKVSENVLSNEITTVYSDMKYYYRIKTTNSSNELPFCLEIWPVKNQIE